MKKLPFLKFQSDLFPRNFLSKKNQHQKIIKKDLKIEALTGIWQRVGSQWAASNCRLVRLEGAALLLTTPSQPTTPNNNAHSRI
jgi:hypothetical protein